MGEEMIGREIEWNGKRGKVMAVRPAKLVDAETGEEFEAVKFRVAPEVGDWFWTHAVRPV